jgi:uncharacterized protein (TIGR03437 family)
MSKTLLIVAVAVLALPMAAWPGAASNPAAAAAAGQRIAATPDTGFTLSQTITFNPLFDWAVGVNEALNATASSGLTVTFTSTTTSVCTIGTTLGHPYVTGVSVGTCSVTASQAGGSGYKAAPDVTQTAQVVGDPQTITFPALPSIQVGYVENLNATASSGLPVSFGSQTPSVCTIPSGGMAVTSVAIGTCIVVASQSGNSTYAAAPIVSQKFLVTGEGQTIGAITAIGGGRVGDTQTLSATATSGLQVSFNSQTNNTCTVSGSTVALIAVGTCTVQATQAGDGATWAAATPVTKSGTVLQGSQTIINYTLRGPVPQKVGDQYTIGADATSGLTVTFASLTPSVCTLSGTVNGSTLTLIAIGTCQPQATQAGNANWAAATPVNPGFTVAQGTLTITFGPIYSVVMGLPGSTVSATVTEADGQPGPGTPVFTSNTPNTCSVTGSLVTGVNVGQCTILATVAASTNFAAATNTFSFPVQMGAQTIDFHALADLVVGGRDLIDASASSGLPVNLASLTPTVCVRGKELGLPIVVAQTIGTCTVEATQAGNGNFGAATPVDRSFTVSGKSQTIAFAALSSQTLGAAPFAIGATASSGLPVSFASTTAAVCTVSGSTVTLVAVGTCTIQATQAGDSTTWAAATPVTQGFTVTAAPLTAQTITFNPLANQTLGAAPFTISATATSNLPVSFLSITPAVCTVNGTQVTLVAVGTCTIQANQGGNGTYSGAPAVQQSFAVTAAPLTAQTITFNALPDQTLGAAPFTIAATATSGLAVTFASLTASICTVNGTTVTLVAVGTCTIQASQPGDGATYAAATPVTQSFNVGSQPSNPAPVIGALVNNYSNLNPAAPNYGIAPGMLMKIWGSNMAAANSSALPLQNPAINLPETLNGSSVSITIGGATVTPGFYFAIPSQLAVVLPSNTPVGTGTITVSYGGQTSAAFPITVVASAFGFDYYNGALGVATDNNDGHLITSTASAMPGETIDFWGAGDGADTKNTDLGPPTSFDNLAGITALYIGGVPVPIAYQGRSGYQGVDQVAVTLPSSVPLGCSVSVVAVIGSGSAATVSNLVTIPIATNGGTCADSMAYVNPTTAATLSTQANVAFGVIQVGQTTGPNATGTGTTTTDSADAIFYSFGGAALPGYQSGTQPSLGSCVVTQNVSSVIALFAPVGLNAGTVTVQGPVGGVQTLTTVPSVPGAYVAESLPAGFVPASGGTFTFTATGATGTNGVGSFTEGLSAPAPLVWSNAASLGPVTRSQGVTVNWTGGGNGFVQISGGSIATSASGAFDATFTCNAAASAGTFTVPPSVLLALPLGSGSLSVSNYTMPQNFAVSGLDFAVAIASATTDIAATYN